MDNPIIIFGAKSLGISALEIFELNNTVVYGFLDDDSKLHNQEIGDITILGNTDNEGFTKLIGKKCDAFVAVDNSKHRQMLTEMLLDVRKVMPVNAIHPKAMISKFASIGHGNLFATGATLSAKAMIGSHCIIGANAVIEPECEIEDYVQIGSGTIINSSVKIAKGAFIGSGVTVISGVSIGKNARIGAGSVVMNDIKSNQTVFGVPAKEV
ncbi:MAG: acetyltransferase [Bacteroidetes bacterium]|nr:MAG: acetyltransferase [Bacteroidota bacterium]